MNTQIPARGGRILPRDKGTAPLDVVIAIMAFLAALSLGASLIAQRTAEGWREGLVDRLTVQIVPAVQGNPSESLARETANALEVLRATPGIARAAPLSTGETAALVEPWLGKNAIIPELPMPVLIDASIAPGEQIDLIALAGALKRAAPNSVLDDHSRWIGRLRGLADTIIFSAYGVLVLIAIALAATVAFATRAGLDANRELVELLHQTGAQGGFIAGAFERHYLVSALLAGVFGAGAAAFFFVVAGGLELVGIQTVPFLPPLALRFNELPWLACVPAGAAIIALATARLSVLGALRRIY
jgi:cell division transport system permease protein